MDLAVYISEILGLHGEVNVPEIGYFAQIRTNGYYNKEENKFYPPGHDISFQPQFTEDDLLAKYISGKKNISLASSKYFIDKYVTDVKQQAATRKVDIAGLGYLHSENSTLSFKPANTSRDNDPAFYGFQPVRVYRAGERPAESLTTQVTETEIVEQKAHIIEEVPVKDALEEILTDKDITIPTIITPDEGVHEETEYHDDEIVPNRFVNIWVVLLLIITIVGLALLGIYQYYPSVFDKFMSTKQAPIVKPTAVKPANPPVIKSDTLAKTAATPPTKLPAPAVTQRSAAITSNDSSKLAHYEILGGAFVKLNEAEKTVNNYKKMGLDARILENVPGRLKKITLGTYYTPGEAVAAQNKILSTKRISRKTIYIQFYKAKK